MKNSEWLTGKVIKGKKVGIKIGYPTINIDKPDLMQDWETGVYACWVRVFNKIYKSVLFFWPRLIHQEYTNIIEIFIFDFDREVYGKNVDFLPIKYIRAPIKFKDIKNLKKQLLKDCKTAQKMLELIKPADVA